MKYLKKEEKKGSFWKILLVIVLVAAAFVGGVFTGPLLIQLQAPTETMPLTQDTEPEETTPPAQETEPEETMPPTQDTEPVETTSSETEDILSSNAVFELLDGDIVIPTPYGEVRYTAEFAEFIDITHEFTRDQYAVHFDANLDTNVSARVFSVYFAEDTGHQPDGTPVNTVQAEDGTERLVLVTVNLDFPDPAWDTDLSNLAYAMQEGISYTMEQLTHLE